MKHSYISNTAGTFSSNRSGFTVVELLVVIVAIAILAAIAVVGYTAMQDRAAIVALQSDLHTDSSKIEADKRLQRSATYPSSSENIDIADTCQRATAQPTYTSALPTTTV